MGGGGCDQDRGRVSNLSKRFRSRLRYWIASLKCSAWMFSEPVEVGDGADDFEDAARPGKRPVSPRDRSFGVPVRRRDDGDIGREIVEFPADMERLAEMVEAGSHHTRDRAHRDEC